MHILSFQCFKLKLFTHFEEKYTHSLTTERKQVVSFVVNHITFGESEMGWNSLTA